MSVTRQRKIGCGILRQILSPNWLVASLLQIAKAGVSAKAEQLEGERVEATRFWRQILGPWPSVRSTQCQTACCYALPPDSDSRHICFNCQAIEAAASTTLPLATFYICVCNPPIKLIHKNEMNRHRFICIAIAGVGDEKYRQILTEIWHPDDIGHATVLLVCFTALSLPTEN